MVVNCEDCAYFGLGSNSIVCMRCYRFSNYNPRFSLFGSRNQFQIEKVIFNEPATIVKWVDGTKTVVKCQEGDYFDPEKGLAMAIAKKAFGNKGNYCEQIKKWTEPYYEKKDEEAQNQLMFDFISSDALAEKVKHLLGL